jgi:hypothetical protein
MRLTASKMSAGTTRAAMASQLQVLAGGSG